MIHTKFIKAILGIVFFAFLVTGCDIIEEPYYEGGAPPPPPEDTMIRKVLIEDFTGVKCNYCPLAAVEAELLKDFYGERLVVIAVHAGWASEPPYPPPIELDLRCDAGEDIRANYGIETFPQGLVNRREFSGNPLISYGNWSSGVAEILSENVMANIEIQNSYNSSEGELSVVVASEFFITDANNYSLCVYLTEDSIISSQSNQTASIGTTPVIANYVHMHVLRDAINSSWGDQIVTGGATAGMTDTSSYVYDFTAHPDFVPEKCSVVAFIYNNATKEIIQVEEKHIH